jgi:uncharacterized protein with NRDE domain
MCVIFLSVGATQGYKLIVLANRDELLDRPTEAAKFWEDSGFLILGGRDLARQGTWFGVTKTGRIAMVTNYRVAFDQLRTDANSRGQILLDYLKSDVPVREFVHKLHAEKEQYDGFNVILGTVDELWYFGNRDEGDKPVMLEKGKFYGLSNRILDTPWQKVELGKQMLSEVNVKSYNGDEDKMIKDLFAIINDKRNVPRDDMVPDTGVGFEIEKHMQPIFIEPFPMLHSVFGTRAQTILLIDEEDNLTFVEHAMVPGGNDWNENKFKFKMGSPVN